MSTEETKDITLDDLMKEKEETVTEAVKETGERFKTVSISDIAGTVVKKTAQQVAEDSLMSEIDFAINRVKEEQFAPLIEEGKAMIMEKKLEHDENETEEEKEETTTNTITTSDADDDEDNDIIPRNREIIDEIDNLDDEDEEEQKEEEFTEEQKQEILNNFKSQIKAVIKPAKERLDISKFTVRTKGVAVSKVLSTKVPSKHVTDWVLPNTKRSISMTELSGSEIEKLNIALNQRNKLNSIKNLYTIIYDHILDSNKPSTLEEWVKSISWFDTTHLYFAIYKACFENGNYVPYVCTNNKCNNTFIIQHKIEDMIKYKDEEAKAKIRKIFEKDTTAPSTIEASLVPISNDYCVSLRVPSIYNVAFENAVLDENFQTKYSEMLSIISFIENIYSIEHSTMELVPIETKVDSDDIVKTIKYKIRGYHKILSKLTPDEFIELRDLTNKMMLDEDESITYVYPEVECPKCKTKIDERAVDPLSMVFTRHRLTTIANS